MLVKFPSFFFPPSFLRVECLRKKMAEWRDFFLHQSKDSRLSSRAIFRKSTPAGPRGSHEGHTLLFGVLSLESCDTQNPL